MTRTPIYEVISSEQLRDPITGLTMLVQSISRLAGLEFDVVETAVVSAGNRARTDP